MSCFLMGMELIGIHEKLPVWSLCTRSIGLRVSFWLFGDSTPPHPAAVAEMSTDVMLLLLPCVVNAIIVFPAPSPCTMEGAASRAHAAKAAVNLALDVLGIEIGSTDGGASGPRIAGASPS